MGSSEENKVMLEDSDQLLLLAKILLNQEEALMKNIKSESERVKYLNECNESYNKVVSLLKDSDDLNNKHKNDKIKSSIAEDIHKYIKWFLNTAMQWIRNCKLRVSCIAKIKIHFDALVTELEGLNEPTNLSKYGRLAKEVSSYKDFMWHSTNQRRSASARALCKAASLVWKEQRLTFPQLVDSHKTKLNFEGEFQNLEDVQKLQVYNSIIEDAGTAKIPKLELLSSGFGVAVLVVTVGLMVLDIFTAHCPIEAIARNTLTAASEVGAFATQLLVEGLVTEGMTLVGLGEALGVFVVALAGMATGFIAGFLFMGASGLLIDNLIEGGGHNAPAVENLNGIRVLPVKTPDGEAIANEIAHHFGLSSVADSSKSNEIACSKPTAAPAYYQQARPAAGPDHRQQYGMTPPLNLPTALPDSRPTHRPPKQSSEFLRLSPRSEDESLMNPVEYDNAFPTITPPNPEGSWPMDSGATFYKSQYADEEHNCEI